MSSKTPTKPSKADLLKGIEPKQHIVNVVMTDGTKFQIMTTWGKEGDTLKLDVDPKNHPAWQDSSKNFINVNNERVAKFKSKFGDFDLIGKSKSNTANR